MYTHMSKQYSSVSMSSREQLPTLKITNGHCTAEIALFGAHLLSFVPNADATERLWLSETAVFNKSKPIRGGIPICWPWFADIYPDKDASDNTKLPAHGFVRTQDWQVIEIAESTDATTITLSPNQLGLYGFSEKLLASVEFTFSKKCSIRLITKNTSKQALTITAALHSYFNVTNIHQTKIIGVAGKYIDKTNASAAFEQLLPYLISSETDRIHLQDENNHFDFIHLICPDKKISIEQHGHDSVVIWNPWQKKSKTMADMQDNSYIDMLCIEASITQGTILAAQQQHELVQIIG
ncbi:glucose-6-phosphate 1-epimerase [Glaciecola pallidula DSM 14239 = ACAM 615]|uniref:Putative glucose-6-phosphate 1-epimerase n=2 Tax=Brumicola TaxID=3160924 RepID=K6Y6C4_9ALTE|nr:glucose-6-phosphate 1-epimerase [Glaciecola pallidula DSM 14239 = ACAM 615]